MMFGPRGEQLPGAILFCCNHNSVRSPMLLGLARQLYRKTVFLDACGVHHGVIDPMMMETISEIGAPLHDYAPKTFQDIDPNMFDLVITLTPEAHHQAIELTHYTALDIEYWPTEDPTVYEGSRERRLDAYRSVRDHLLKRLQARFPAATSRF